MYERRLLIDYYENIKNVKILLLSNDSSIKRYGKKFVIINIDI